MAGNTFTATLCFLESDAVTGDQILSTLGREIEVEDQRVKGWGFEVIYSDEISFDSADDAIRKLLDSIPISALGLDCKKILRLAVFAITYTVTIRISSAVSARLPGIELQASIYPSAEE